MYTPENLLFSHNNTLNKLFLIAKITHKNISPVKLNFLSFVFLIVYLIYDSSINLFREHQVDSFDKIFNQ